ncbi:WLM domain-containing protein [Hygrophoropsis aurantiaca]|uniref:WLM domain-containing protein n=1 Tax=Hygrophoropsis aurantiaca TaxID=72124 RepID=A0ACB8AJ33_9AGAM|nr:WLM domain-containing protein [Hygrophoropsis aurantiaca]
MVHIRINERESNPNPHVNFISVLHAPDSASEEVARQLMRALAAQVKPIMAAHGFAVNSFEEYEYNRVFAGRNWNNGETIELVLRSASGMLLPTHWLMSTLCHELAHITHMNHGPDFQSLWRQLRNEVRALQNKGYYGDGYWSSGTRLADSARITGQGIEYGDLPEYMCGGAQSRARPSALRKRRQRLQAGPSNHTGAQTAKKRKIGSRVTAQVFGSGGTTLNADAEGDQKNQGTGFRKKATSKRAREERALAAERRLRNLAPVSEGLSKVEDDESGSDSDSNRETDQDRRLIMLDTIGKQDLDELKISLFDFSDDFNLPPKTCGTHAINGSNSALIDEASIAGPSNLRSNGDSTVRGKRGRKGEVDRQQSQASKQSTILDAFSPVPNGDQHAFNGKRNRKQPVELSEMNDTASCWDDHRPDNILVGGWACLVCTLQVFLPLEGTRNIDLHSRTNAPQHLACSACNTPRGDSVWADRIV